MLNERRIASKLIGSSLSEEVGAFYRENGLDSSVGAIEEPYICNMGSQGVATRIANAATTTKVQMVLFSILV